MLRSIRGSQQQISQRLLGLLTAEAPVAPTSLLRVLIGNSVGTSPTDRLAAVQAHLGRSHTSAATSGDTISVTFFDEKDGSESTVVVPVGTNLLEAAHNNEVDLEGACEGSLACSTCHVIVQDPELFGKLPEPEDDENDMLDLAYGLTETSRLGCQVIASQELDGMKVRIPSATRNFAVDGYVPKPH